MKVKIAGLLALTLGACATTSSAPTPIGNGLYLLAGRNVTVFGSYDQKVVELMGKANSFCQQQGKAATLINTDGRDSRVGQPFGVVPQAGQTASASITFRCE